MSASPSHLANLAELNAQELRLLADSLEAHAVATSRRPSPASDALLAIVRSGACDTLETFARVAAAAGRSADAGQALFHKTAVEQQDERVTVDRLRAWARTWDAFAFFVD